MIIQYEESAPRLRFHNSSQNRQEVASDSSHVLSGNLSQIRESHNFAMFVMSEGCCPLHPPNQHASQCALIIRS